MTAPDKLAALIAAVDAGDGPGNHVFCMETIEQIKWVVDAWRGSLDAAKTLHEALLPNFIAKLGVGARGAGVTKWHCTVECWDEGDEYCGDNQPNEARAAVGEE